MPDGCDRILDGIFDDMLSKARRYALAETADAMSPLVGTVSQLLYAGAGTGSDHGLFTEGMFYVAGAVRVLGFLGRLRCNR